MKPSKNLENKTPSEPYWRVQLVCKQVKARSSLEPPLEYNQDQTLSTNQGYFDLFNHLGNYKNILQFQTSSGRENS